jgi:hypothetical protein
MAEVESLLRTQEMSLEQIRKLAEGGYLYAIVDAASVPLTPKKVLGLGSERAVSLYRGSAEEEYWDVAPYLMRVDPALLDWIVSISSKEGWGILAAAKVDLETLRKHFRHFLRVKEPGGETWLFRFYDPRVLAPFLPACSRKECQTFFGPVRGFGFISTAQPSSVSFVLQQTAGTENAGRPSRTEHSLFFQLRPEHLVALQPLVEADFMRRLLKYLREDHRGAVSGLTASDLEARAAAGLRRARSYGLDTENSLATFVGLMFEISPKFDEQPRINRVLKRKGVPSVTRFNFLLRATSDGDWEEAASSNGPDAWKNVLEQ